VTQVEPTTQSSAFSAETVVRPAVRAVPSYIPAKLPEDRPTRIIKLDMNESPYGPSPKARAALAAFTDTHRYPDFDAIELRTALAKYVRVPVDQLICGAGLDDVFNSLFTTILDPGDEIIIHEPTFGVYRSLAAHHGAKTVNVQLDDDFALDAAGVLAAVTPRTKLIILCTPNNPTGNLLDPAAVEHVIANAPCLVAIDEAYAEFAGNSHRGLLDRHPNVAILRTMSKFAGLAGMRVGYGVFPVSLMPYLLQVTPPFHNVSVASTAAAIASLDDLDYLQGIIDRIVRDRETLADNLRELPGVEPLPSATNFLLVRLPVTNAVPVVKKLAQRGILVRDYSRADLGIQDCLRVTIGDLEENELFFNTLAEILEGEARA
jgi:histidinol-phosphate aminotransferase